MINLADDSNDRQLALFSWLNILRCTEERMTSDQLKSVFSLACLFDMETQVSCGLTEHLRKCLNKTRLSSLTQKPQQQKLWSVAQGEGIEKRKSNRSHMSEKYSIQKALVWPSEGLDVLLTCLYSFLSLYLISDPRRGSWFTFVTLLQQSWNPYIFSRCPTYFEMNGIQKPILRWRDSRYLSFLKLL